MLISCERCFNSEMARLDSFEMPESPSAQNASVSEIQVVEADDNE